MFPPLATIAAFLAAAALARSLSSRLALTLLLLFGQEVASFGSSAVTHLLPGPFTLGWVRTAAGPYWQRLVPDYYTSYFSLFRTPEPQVSLVIGFVTLALVIALVRGVRSPRLVACLAAMHLLLPWTYVFITAPVVLFEGLLAADLALTRRTDAMRTLAACLGVTLAVFAGQAAWGLTTGGGSGTISRHLYASSLPVVTPAVVYAVALLACCVVVRRTADRTMLGLAVAAGAVPLVLTNQQLLTHLMASARDFERYSNYPLLVIGAAALGVAVRTIPVHRPRTTALALIVTAAMLALVVEGQRYTYRAFTPANDRASAAAFGLREALEASPARVVVLADPGLAPDVAIRLPAAPVLEFVPDYADVPRRPLVDTSTAGGRASRAYFRGRLFESFARWGYSCADVRRVLDQEARTIGTGPAIHLQFLFHLSRVWYPFSDARLLDRTGVMAEIEGISTAYGQFLEARPPTLDRVALLVRPSADGPPVDAGLWTHRQVATGRAGASAMVVYEQRPAWLTGRPGSRLAR